MLQYTMMMLMIVMMMYSAVNVWMYYSPTGPCLSAQVDGSMNITNPSLSTVYPIPSKLKFIPSSSTTTSTTSTNSISTNSATTSLHLLCVSCHSWRDGYSVFSGLHFKKIVCVSFNYISAIIYLQPFCCSTRM